MNIALLSLALVLVATQVMACFSPTRPVDDLPTAQLPDCSVRGKLLDVGPAYRLRSGLVAQTWVKRGFCNEVYSAGSLVVDCDAKRMSVVVNRNVLKFEPSGALVGPTLRADLQVETLFDPPEDARILTFEELAPDLTDASTGQIADPFCGCALTDIPANEKG